MSTRYNTGNPIESTDVRDMSDNAKNFDEFSNSSADTFTDRLGVSRKTIDGAIRSVGIPIIGNFTTGCTVTDSNQGVQEVGGSVYRWSGALPKIVPSSSTPSGTGGISPSGDWVDIGDASLRGDLVAPGGGALVGGVDTPAASSDFAGGMLPSLPDNSAQANAAFGSGKNVRIDAGEYEVSSSIIANDKTKVSIMGVGLDTKIHSSGTSGVVSISRAGSANIKEMLIDGGGQNLPQTKHIMAFIDQPNLTVEDVKLTGLAGVGTGLIAYSASATPTKNIKVRGVSVYGDRTNSVNTNGILLESAEQSILTESLADGIIKFALELKSFARHNLVSDSVSNNSNAGLYYGSSTPGSYPEYNAASNIISKDCDFGYVSGFGVHNILHGYLCDARGAKAGTPEGARVAGNDNSIFGMKFVAGINGNAVRYNDNALNNFTQMTYSKGSGPTQRAVVLSSGAKRNVTEITHPGNGVDSIFNYIGDASGSGLSGSNANITYCHATGEYYGSFSTGWLWRNGVSGGSRLSSHKWRMESTGTSLLSISTDGTGLSGLNVNTPAGNRNFNWLESGGYWDLSGGDFSVRFFSSAIRPGSDNTMDFGTASNRGRIGYFAQGVQTTSDARLKSPVREMSDAELRAGAAIAKSIGVFTWLKDDSDRLHVGTTVQTIIACMEAEGLNAFEYGFVCHDEWGDQYDEVDEEDGNPSRVLIREAGDLYTLREHELYKFLVRAQEHRISELERRLSEY